VTHDAKRRILESAVKASFARLGKQPGCATMRSPRHAAGLQIDGDVTELPAGATVRVDLASRSLHTVL
jgi:hypothetical protein